MGGEKGLKRRNNLMMKSRRLFEMSLYGNIIYNMLGMEAYVEYLNESDKTVLKAVEILERQVLPTGNNRRKGMTSYG